MCYGTFMRNEHHVRFGLVSSSKTASPSSEMGSPSHANVSKPERSIDPQRDFGF